jgi:hypothetical protein
MPQRYKVVALDTATSMTVSTQSLHAHLRSFRDEHTIVIVHIISQEVDHEELPLAGISHCVTKTLCSEGIQCLAEGSLVLVVSELVAEDTAALVSP